MRDPEFRDRIHAYERTPEWTSRSRRYRATHDRRCAACREEPTETNRLDVHHLTYDRAFTGQEPDRDLIGLCHRCHMAVHDLCREQHYSIPVATNLVIDAADQARGTASHATVGHALRGRKPWTPRRLAHLGLWAAYWAGILYVLNLILNTYDGIGALVLGTALGFGSILAATTLRSATRPRRRGAGRGRRR